MEQAFETGRSMESVQGGGKKNMMQADGGGPEALERTVRVAHIGFNFLTAICEGSLRSKGRR